MDRKKLMQHSLEIIQTNQSPSGAYIASPKFHEYRFSWLRDGSFIGYSMLVNGFPESTEAFLRWVSRAVERNQPDWEQLENTVHQGGMPPKEAYLPTRFTLEGEASDDDWPNFQLDGYGHWLWLLGEWTVSINLSEIPDWATTAVEITVRYLNLVWNLPNFDAWEEHGDKIHPVTLSGIYGGLKAVDHLGFPCAGLIENVKALALSELTTEGSLAKYLGSQAVDSSMLWVSVPFNMLRLDDPIMLKTAERIEMELKISGGLVRYKADTYFGGGRWILLTASLGWYYLRSGNRSGAEECAKWIENHASESGDLPEQISDEALDPSMVNHWENRWGAVAEPLLWSHAMYAVLANELEMSTGITGI